MRNHQQQGITQPEMGVEGGLDGSRSDRIIGKSSNKGRIPTQVGRLFYALGFFGASYPFVVIFLSIMVVLLSCYPLLTMPIPGNRPKEFITPFQNYSSPSSLPNEETPASWPRWYKGPQTLFVQQILVKSSVYPWNSNLILADAFRGTLSESFHLVDIVRNTTLNRNGRSIGLSGFCFRVSNVKSKALTGKNSMLPEHNCLVVSPINLWHESYSTFQNDADLIGTILRYQSNEKGRSGLAELLLGINVKDTGFKRYPYKTRQRLVSYAVTLILEKYDSLFIAQVESNLKQYYGEKSAAHFLDKFPHQNPNDNRTIEDKDKRIIHIFYPNQSSLLQLVPLVVTYTVMFLYLYFSVKKIQMIKSKLGMAFSALISVVASLCMAVGLCTHFGLTYEINAKAIFPYVVVIVGLENMLVLTRSVVSTASHLDVKIRIAQGLSKEGWSIIKNLSAEITVLSIGFFTFIPKIQEFCILAILGLLSDFFIQIFFFVPVLSVDIRHSELIGSGNHPASAFTPFRKPIHPKLNRVKSNNGLVNGSGNSTYNKSGGSIPVVAPSQLSPILVKIPKRLRVLSFWARTRFFQRTFVILMVAWMTFIIYESGIILPFHIESEADDVVIPNIQAEEPTGLKQRVSLSVGQNAGGSYVVNRTLLQNNKIPNIPEPQNNLAEETIQSYHNAKLLSDLNQCNPHTWKRLSLYHWQVLLGIYNVSLSGKYISILPPICIPVIIDPAEAIDRRNAHDQDYATNAKFNWQALKNAFERIDFADDDAKEGSTRRKGKADEGFFYSFASSLEDPYIPSSPMELALAVLLAIPSVVFLSYSLIVFYRCVCSRNYAEWRSSWTNRDTQDYYTQVVFEAVPLVLDGHKQDVECVGSDGNVITSVCLDGILKIWNINTGDILTTIDRKSYFEQLSIHTDNDTSGFFMGSDADSPIDSSPPTATNLDNVPLLKDANTSFVTESDFPKRQHYSFFESPATFVGTNHELMFSSHHRTSSQSVAVTSENQLIQASTEIYSASKHKGHRRLGSYPNQQHHFSQSSYKSSPITIPVGITSVSPQSVSAINTVTFSSVNVSSTQVIQRNVDSQLERPSILSSTPPFHSSSRESFNRSNSRTQSPGARTTSSDLLDDVPPVWCLDCVENIVVLGTGSGVIEFWDASTGYLKCTYDDESGVGVMCVKLVGNKVVVAKINGSLDFLQLESRPPNVRECESPSLYHRFPNSSSGNGSNGRSSAYCYESEIRCLWLSTHKAHQQPITCVDCDNINIITGSQDHCLKVFRLEDQSPVLSLHGHYGPITCVFIDKASPLTSGSGSQDGLLCVWDLQTGMCVYSIQAHDGPISAITYSVSYVISAGGDDKICVWERFQGHLLSTIQLDHAYCSSLVMLTHNLLITSKQGSLIVWDVRSGEAVRAVRLGHRDTTVFVRQIMVCSDAILCDYGSQLRLVRFPSVISKVD